MNSFPSERNSEKIELEKSTIKEAIINFYQEGHIKSDPELYNKILHNEWKFFLFNEDKKLRIVDKEEYLSWYNPEEVDESLTWNTEFYYIDVTGDIGAVKLKLECEIVGYIDYFNLMKINGKWWIVHKLSFRFK